MLITFFDKVLCTFWEKVAKTTEMLIMLIAFLEKCLKQAKC